MAYYQTLDAVLAEQQAIDNEKSEKLEAHKAELELRAREQQLDGERLACSFIDLDDLKDEVRHRSESTRQPVRRQACRGEGCRETSQTGMEGRAGKLKKRINGQEANAGELAVAADKARQASRLRIRNVHLRKEIAQNERPRGAATRRALV